MALTPQEIESLEKLIASKADPSGSEWRVKRAQALLAMAKGDRADRVIAAELDVSASTVCAMRNQFHDGGVHSVLAVDARGARKPIHEVRLSLRDDETLREVLASKSGLEWQVKRCKALLAMSKNDKTDKLIAEELGISTDATTAIRRRFHDGGIHAVLAMIEPRTFAPILSQKPRPRKLSPDQVMQADSLHSEGVSYRQLVRQFAADGITITPEGIRFAIKRDAKQER